MNNAREIAEMIINQKQFEQEDFMWLVHNSEVLARSYLELEKSILVPGIFRCAKCNFILHSKSINMNSGDIGANNNPQECLNGCGPMWRITYKERCSYLTESYDKLFSEITKLKEENEKLKKSREVLSKAVDKILNGKFILDYGIIAREALKADDEIMKGE